MTLVYAGDFNLPPLSVLCLELQSNKPACETHLFDHNFDCIKFSYTVKFLLLAAACVENRVVKFRHI